MNKRDLQVLLNTWFMDMNNDDLDLLGVKNKVDFLERQLYQEYVPTQGAGHPDFGSRLAAWIGSAQNESDQISLYRMLWHIHFVGENEVKAGYRTAYSKEVITWISQLTNLNPFLATAEDSLRDAMSAVAYTRFTDSFDLPTFLRINNVQGQSSRFTWRDHETTWDEDAFNRDVLEVSSVRPRRYLVIFEDFVGSGSQISRALRLIQSLQVDVEVLICPVVICPDGAELCRTIAAENTNITYRPILELKPEFFLKSTPQPGEPVDFPRIRRSLDSVHPLVTNHGGSAMQQFGPYGFGPDGGTGGLVIKYDNCPDNTVPSIHRGDSTLWEPLFLRNSREEI